MDDYHDDFWDGPEWQDWMIIGPLAEELADENREKRRIEREFEDDDFDPPY